MKWFLSLDDFDPMKVDVEEIDKASNLLPKSGFMDIGIAEELATVTLRASDYATDLLAQAVLYLSHCEAKKRETKADAIMDAMGRKVPSTIMKDAVLNDQEYLKWVEKYNVATAWHTWLNNKLQTLTKAHHLCKEFLKRASTAEGLSSFSPTSDSIAAGEERDRAEKSRKKERKPGEVSWG